MLQSMGLKESDTTERLNNSSSSKLISSNRIIVNEAVNNQLTIKIARRNINNLRYMDNTTFVAESKKELKSLLMR